MEVSDGLETLIKREIDRLHIPPTIRGHRYLTYMVGQIVIAPERIEGITKDLYRETARRFKTNWNAVARSSWTAIACCWECEAGRDRLCMLAGYRLTERPTTSAFLAVVAQYISRNCRTSA